MLLLELLDPSVGSGHDLLGLRLGSDAHRDRRPLAEVAEICDFVSLGVDPVDVAWAAGQRLSPENEVEGGFDGLGQLPILRRLLDIARGLLHF